MKVLGFWPLQSLCRANALCGAKLAPPIAMPAAAQSFTFNYTEPYQTPFPVSGAITIAGCSRPRWGRIGAGGTWASDTDVDLK